jgi:hypothetical protein
MYNPVAELNTAVWNELNPRRCPCRGSGWLISDYDTFHRCCTHGAGVPHPEDEHTDFDGAAHRLKLLRVAYKDFLKMARDAGFTGDFHAAVEAKAEGDSPQALVDAAEAIAEDWDREARETSARRDGYCCDLERRLTEDAEREAFERRGY